MFSDTEPIVSKQSLQADSEYMAQPSASTPQDTVDETTTASGPYNPYIQAGAATASDSEALPSYEHDVSTRLSAPEFDSVTATVPAYTEIDSTATLISSLDSIRIEAIAADVTLPITKFLESDATKPSEATTYTRDSATGQWRWHTYQPTVSHQIINSFFRAILSKNDELVTLFVREGLISPDCADARGETPLIAAVASGNGQMVCTLLNLGADVNLLGRYDPIRATSARSGDLTEYDVIAASYRLESENREFAGALPLRTPLMVAASRGNLALVKLLMNDFKADDSIIAPDGQLALRLAVEVGRNIENDPSSTHGGAHREVVDFLPSRRGGAWRRWKTHHAVAVRRFRRAGENLFEFLKFFVWTTPKFFLWSCPKHVLFLPIYRGTKWAWEKKGKFPGWCKKQVKALPGRLKRGAEKIGRGVKAVGRGIAKIPEALWKILKWMFGVIKRIPGFMKIVGLWIWDCLKRLGIAVGHVFLKVVSVIHTAVMAVLDFFRRITLKDIWDGLVSVMRAVFVGLPRAIWEGVRSFAGFSYDALKKLFGWVGELLWYMVLGIGWVLIFIPKQLWKMLTAIGSSIAKGWHEILVWLNPKH